MASSRGRGFQSGHSDRLRPAYVQQKELDRARQEAKKPRQQEIDEGSYQCECCLNVFQKTRTDEEAMREAKDRFPNDDMSDAAVVCDTCYEAIMAAIKRGEIP